MTQSLTEGRIGRLLIRFSLPFLLSAIIQSAYSSVDIIFLGKFASASSLAGAGNSASLMMTVNSIFNGITSGGMILLGQFFGAKDDKRCATTTGNTILVALLSAVISAVILLSFGQSFLRLVKVPEEAMTEAWTYMRICAFGLIPTMGYALIGSVLRALGNSKMPLVFVAISCALNIVLDYIFVVLLQMGAAGAAFATIIAQTVSLILSIIYIMHSRLPFSFSIADVAPERTTILTMLRLGIPISLQTVLNMFSFVIIGRIINEMGLAASASNGIVNNIVNFYMIIPMSLGSAVSAIAAQNIGANKPERAISTTKIGVLIGLAIAIPCVLIADIFPQQVCSLFSNDANVIKASADFLISFSWDFIFVSFVFCINGLFNGAGITTFVAVQETIAAFAVRIPLTYALSLLPNVTMFHIGISTPAATASSLLMYIIYYYAKHGKIGVLANRPE